MLRALSDIYGSGLLVIVLTGMGQDGMVGAQYAAGKGAKVIVQDEATSVVWGMPGAVVKAGIADIVAPLNEIAAQAGTVMGRVV